MIHFSFDRSWLVRGRKYWHDHGNGISMESYGQ